jgi:hypothetical protein
MAVFSPGKSEEDGMSMIRISPRSGLALGLVAAAVLWAGSARSQLTAPDERFTYKPCLKTMLRPGQAVKIPARCAKRDGHTRIIIVLKGGVAGANLRVSGIGEFRISGRHKQLRLAVGTAITLLRVSSLGGPGGVMLVVLDYSKPIPVGSVWDDDEDPTNPTLKPQD